jgi:hypothetical protein
MSRTDGASGLSSNDYRRGDALFAFCDYFMLQCGYFRHYFGGGDYFMAADYSWRHDYLLSPQLFYAIILWGNAGRRSTTALKV